MIYLFNKCQFLTTNSPFLPIEYGSELRRQENFINIWGIASLKLLKVEVYTCTYMYVLVYLYNCTQLGIHKL